MIDHDIYIRPLDKPERTIDWTEINQLKKDILWFFDENVGQLQIAFVPDYSFKSNYWEYLTMNGDKFFYEEDRIFFNQGALIIIIGMTIEYLGTDSGNQKIFGETTITHILNYVDNFIPINANQKRLKETVKLGLEIANLMTEQDLINTDKFEHKDLDKFNAELFWVDETFIKAYYRTKINYA